MRPRHAPKPKGMLLTKGMRKMKSKIEAKVESAQVRAAWEIHIQGRLGFISN